MWDRSLAPLTLIRIFRLGAWISAQPASPSGAEDQDLCWVKGKGGSQLQYARVSQDGEEVREVERYTMPRTGSMCRWERAYACQCGSPERLHGGGEGGSVRSLETCGALLHIEGTDPKRWDLPGVVACTYDLSV